MVEKVVKIVVEQLDKHGEKLRCTTPEQWRGIEFRENPNTQQHKYFDLTTGNKGKRLVTNIASIIVHNATSGERLKTKLVESVEEGFLTFYHYKVKYCTLTYQQ